jgi:hypothetical protein
VSFEESIHPTSLGTKESQSQAVRERITSSNPEQQGIAG